MSEDLELLGPIVRLQIQKEPLIVGVRPDRTYRTEPITVIDSMTISPEGALAKLDAGWVVDVHHTAHPANSRPNLDRLLSVGFTSHYSAMQDHFGDMPIGDAGENIVVDTDRMVTLDEITGGLVIRRSDRDVELKGAAVAEPCVPFTRYALRDRTADLDVVKPNRDFLRRGMRGYVMGLSNLDAAIEISVGDEVFLRV